MCQVSWVSILLFTLLLGGGAEKIPHILRGEGTISIFARGGGDVFKTYMKRYCKSQFILTFNHPIQVVLSNSQVNDNPPTTSTVVRVDFAHSTPTQGRITTTTLTTITKTITVASRSLR